MSEVYNRTAHLRPTGEPSTVQQKSETKVEEILIEEILKAAGLEALD